MSRTKRHPLKQWLGRLVRLLAIVVAVPLVLVPLYWVVPPVSTLMAARYVTGQDVVRDWRDIDTISDRLKVSVMLSEDGQFCRHLGIDVGALKAEIEAVLKGQPARGASTLTMQVARNLFLWNGRSYVRKALEIPLALYIDLVLSKRRIMEIYLNIAEWGPNGQFGIEAGVNHAFAGDADALTWRRATLMAISLPNPHLRQPANPSRGMVRVARIIEQRTRTFSNRAQCLFMGDVPPLN